MKKIESVNNQHIKNLTLLQSKSKLRKKQERFLIEGLREIILAKKGGYVFDEILFCSEIISIDLLTNKLGFDYPYTEVSFDVYHKLAYRDSTEGVLALTQSKAFTFDKLNLPSNPLILVAEAIEKPGNIGAILRTADAAQVDAVFIANPKTDLYNPNIIRASVGCVFTNTIICATSSQIIQYLQQNNIDIYSATLQDSKPYTDTDYTQGTAIVVGSEDVGVSEEFRQNSKYNIRIPMGGIIDSMNVSVAAAILIFEAKRQRGFL
ncbi:MAG: RNA methyltransferase [Bacteroidota bacterium]|nr:RNA methyltransferase [Bacteroidota bacterium]